MPQVQGPALSAWLSVDLWPVGCCAGSALQSPLCSPAVSPQSCSLKICTSTIWGSKDNSLCPVHSTHLRISGTEGRDRWKNPGERPSFPQPPSGSESMDSSIHFHLASLKVVAQCGLLKFLHILNLFLISLPLAPHPLSSKSKFKANYFKPKTFIFCK